jgi:hypothetical protein
VSLATYLVQTKLDTRPDQADKQALASEVLLYHWRHYILLSFPHCRQCSYVHFRFALTLLSRSELSMLLLLAPLVSSQLADFGLRQQVPMATSAVVTLLLMPAVFLAPFVHSLDLTVVAVVAATMPLDLNSI